MALRQHPSIPTATSDRVKALAHSLGYAPDPMLGALADYRNRMRPRRIRSVVALVSNWDTREGWLRLPDMRRVLAGAENRAAALGYHIQHFWANKASLSPTRLSQILAARGIKGALLAPRQLNEEHAFLDRDAFCQVALSHPAPEGNVSHVGANHYSNILRCWRELRVRGYSRVGLIVNPERMLGSEDQSTAAHGFVQAQYAAAHDWVPTLSLADGDHCSQVRRWLREHRPHAVINSSPEFHAAAEAEQLSIPQHVGYISLDVRDDVSGAAGIDPLGEVVGEIAIEMLGSLLQRGFRSASTHTVSSLVAGTWCEGRTLPERARTPKGL